MQTLLFVAVVLVLILIYYSEEFGLHPTIDPENTKPFSQYRNRVITGDIIVAHNSGFISTLIRIYAQSPATHSGVVIVEDGDIYICEIDYYSYFADDIHISKIETFMEKQRSRYIGIIPAPKHVPLRLHDIEKIKCKFDLSMGFFTLPGRIYCTTLVHRLMSRFDILPWNGACEHKTTPKTYHSDPSIVLLDYDR